MFDLEIVVDAEMPSHALYVALGSDGRELRVRVSPDVEPPVLAALDRAIADRVTEAIDAAPSGWTGRDRNREPRSES